VTLRSLTSIIRLYRFKSVHIKSALLLLYLFQTPFDGGGPELYQQLISTIAILLFWFLELSSGSIERQEFAFKAPYNIKFLAVFLIFSTLSVFWSVDKAISSWAILYWTNQLLFFLAVYRHFVRRRDYLSIIKLFILPFSILMSIWGYYQFLNKTSSLYIIDWGRAEAMFAQPNSLGGYLSITLVLLVALYLYENRKKNAILLFSTFILIFATFLTTYSRASWVSFIISICLFLFLLGLKHIRTLIPKLTSLLIGMIITFAVVSDVSESSVFGKAQSIVGENYMPDGLSGRAAYWESAWKLATENPLGGTGIGTYHLAMHSKSDVDYHTIQIWMAHSDYLQFLSEIGFPGTAVLLIALGFYLFYGFRTSGKLKNSDDLFSDNGLIVLGVFAASISPLLHSMVDFDLRTPGVLALFLFLSSMVWHEAEKINITTPINLNFKYKMLPDPVIKVLVAVLALFILYRSSAVVMADHYLEKALESESNESFMEGIDYAHKAVILNGGLSEYHEYLGRNYLRYALFGSDSLSRVNATFESEKEYLLAIEKSPMIELYYLGLATLYQSKGDLFDGVGGKVAHLYEKAIYAKPASNSLRFNFAELLMKVGRYELAIESLEHTLGRGHTVKDAPTLLSEAYRLKGDVEKAIETIDNRLKEDPADGFANFIKGNILVDLENFREAATYFLKALDQSNGENRLDVLKQLAEVNIKIGEVQQAKKYLNEILEVRPNDKFALDLMLSL